MGDKLRDKLSEIAGTKVWDDEFMSKEEALAYVWSVFLSFIELIGLC